METSSESRETEQKPDIPSPVTDKKISVRGMSAIQGIDKGPPGEYKEPTENQDTSILVSDTKRQIDEGINRLSQIEGIRPDKWRESNESERLAALRHTENTMASIQGRSIMDVKPDRMSPGTFGYFDGNAIHINSDGVKSDDVAENVDTIIHEGRHAYQQYAIDHPGFHSDESEVKAWKDNFNNYLDPKLYGQELYQNQPVEADAWAYSFAIRQGLYGNQEVQS